MSDTRRLLWWMTMAGGVGGWWGPCCPGDGPYPNPEQLRTHRDFWQGRFLLDMVRDNSLSSDSNTLVLRSGVDNLVFYKENTNSISVDLSLVSTLLPAVAVDTKKAYQEIEIDLGLLDLANPSISLPYSSDWAIAVGTFGESGEEPLLPEPVEVTFSVDLQGRPDPPDPSWVLPFEVSLIPLDGSLLDPVEVTTSTEEDGVFTLLDIMPGTYDIRAKGANALASESIGVDLTSPDLLVNLGLQQAGDYNGDNEIDSIDHSALVDAFRNQTDELTGNLRLLDFNGDGVVDIVDYAIVVTNFGNTGDQPP